MGVLMGWDWNVAACVRFRRSRGRDMVSVPQRARSFLPSFVRSFVISRGGHDVCAVRFGSVVSRW
jgi:hypothetical protein